MNTEQKQNVVKYFTISAILFVIFLSLILAFNPPSRNPNLQYVSTVAPASPYDPTHIQTDCFILWCSTEITSPSKNVPPPSILIRTMGYNAQFLPATKEISTPYVIFKQDLNGAYTIEVASGITNESNWTRVQNANITPFSNYMVVIGDNVKTYMNYSIINNLNTVYTPVSIQTSQIQTPTFGCSKSVINPQPVTKRNATCIFNSSTYPVIHPLLYIQAPNGFVGNSGFLIIAIYDSNNVSLVSMPGLQRYSGEIPAQEFTDGENKVEAYVAPQISGYSYLGAGNPSYSPQPTDVLINLNSTNAKIRFEIIPLTNFYLNGQMIKNTAVNQISLGQLIKTFNQTVTIEVTQ